MMKQMLAVAVGGACGAMMRFWLAALIQRASGSAFPWGTLTVNVLGSFLLGFLFVWMIERSTVSELARLAITVGFLGAFTTFSTFSIETVRLLQEGALSWAVGNILLQLVLCICVAWVGMLLARML